MIFAGALDEFQVSRSSMLASLEGAMNYGSEQSEQSFFLNGETEPSYESVPPFEQKEMLAFEKEAIGFYLTAHPLDPYLENLKGYIRNTAKEGVAASDREPLRLAVEVLKVRSVRTKKGQMMAFITLGDETGEIDGVVFPDVWEQTETILSKGEFVYIDGVGQRRNDQTNIIISRAMKLKDISPKKVKETLFLKIEPHHHEKGVLEDVKEVLRNHKGNTPVVVYYSQIEKTVKLGQDWLINTDSDCILTLKNLLGESNVVKKTL